MKADTMQKDEEYWREKLTPEQYRILREKGTERPFSGEYLDHSEEGLYKCAGCGSILFASDVKYESNTPGLAGWPSFADVADSNAVRLVPDNSWGMKRTEVICAKCGGHLGHVFDDDDSPNGKHYCINSTCLVFKPENNKKTKSSK